MVLKSLLNYVLNLPNRVYDLYLLVKQLYFIHQIYKLVITPTYTDKDLEDLRKLIFKGGSIYIKLAQWYISKLKHSFTIDTNTRNMDRTIALIKYFDNIFEDCPYHSLEYTKDIFKSEYGVSLDTYIDISTLKPIASGSIGQVYYAKCHKFDSEIAIKVKHPNIDDELAKFVPFIEFVKYMQTFPDIKRKYGLCFDFQDFIDSINMQIDFRNEHYNNKQFRTNFATASHCVIFPDVLFSSRNILISEYIPAVDATTLTNYEQQQTAINLVCIIQQMILVDNFAHGDLHHKNWKVRYTDIKNNTTMRPIIVIYDSGISFKSPSVELSRKFWRTLELNDTDEFCKLAEQFITDSSKLQMTDKCRNEITELMQELKIHSLNTGLIIKRVLAIFGENNIILDNFLINVLVLLCLLEDFLKKNNFLKISGEHMDIMTIIKDTRLDIFTYCEVNKCYLEVAQLIKYNLIEDNKIKQNNNNTIMHKQNNNTIMQNNNNSDNNSDNINNINNSDNNSDNDNSSDNIDNSDNINNNESKAEINNGATLFSTISAFKFKIPT